MAFSAGSSPSSASIKPSSNSIARNASQATPTTRDTLGSIRIGLNGIIGFSTALLTTTLFAGIAIAATALLVGVYVTIMKLGFGEDYPLGFPTITLLIALLGGVQLVAIGILGEYVGRVYDEVKGRPTYIVDRFFNPPAPRAGQEGAPQDGARPIEPVSRQ